MKDFVSHNLTKILILFITFLSFLIQFYKLDNAPVGGLIDESAFGYSAYSILTDGRDEHNQYLPLVFQSHGDQKMPLYIYVLAPLIKIFGLSNFAVRIPSVLSAIFLTPIVYLLLRQFNISKIATLLTSALFSLSPFIFIMGRLGRESTLGLFFYALGLLLYFNSLKKAKTNYFILTVICFGFSWYSYVAYRFVLVLTLPVLILVPVFLKRISIKKFILPATIFLLLVIPSALYGSLFTARLNQVGIYNDKGGEAEIFEKRSYCNFNQGGVLCRLSSNKGIVYGRKIIFGMVESISPQYLFLKGDANLNILNLENYGQYYLLSLPFFYIGLYAFFRNKDQYDKLNLYVLLLILPLSVFPAVIADLGHKMRSAPFILLAIIPIGIGLDFTIKIARKYLNSKTTPLFITTITLLLALSTTIFQTDFHTVHIAKYSTLYNSHIVPLMRFLKQFDGKNPIYIAPFFDDPIMYFAFYNQIDPRQYRANVRYKGQDSGGFNHALSYKDIYAIDIRSEKALLDTAPRPFIYVTNQKLSIEPLYTGYSDNKVHELVFVYQIVDKID